MVLTKKELHILTFSEIQLSEDLKWNKLQNNILLKAYKDCWRAKSFKHEYPLAILKTLYDTLFSPHLSYGILL